MRVRKIGGGEVKGKIGVQEKKKKEDEEEEKQKSVYRINAVRKNTSE